MRKHKQADKQTVRVLKRPVFAGSPSEFYCRQRTGWSDVEVMGKQFKDSAQGHGVTSKGQQGVGRTKETRLCFTMSSFPSLSLSQLSFPSVYLKFLSPFLSLFLASIYHYLPDMSRAAIGAQTAYFHHRISQENRRQQLVSPFTKFHLKIKND